MLVAQASAAPLSEEVSTRVETLSYRSATDSWSRSPFQRIAAQPDHAWSTEVRPDFSWGGEQAAAALRPRLLVVSQAGTSHASNWLNEGWLRWRPLEGVSLQGGREALLWGPSMFWNPSNPFFSESNKSNPKREILGKDFLRGRWQLDQQFALSAISQVGGAHRDSAAPRMDSLKLDWVGQAASAAANVSAEPGQTPAWQAWGQWTASDAQLVYGEFAWRDGAAATLAQPAASPTGWSLRHRSGKRQVLALIGSSYSFENDWVLNLEAWHNGNGLSNAEAAQLASAVAALGAQPHGLADQQLGSLISEPAPLRRNYAGLQLGNGEASQLGWKLRLTRNLDDDGVEGILMLERDLGDQCKLWFQLMRRMGRADSEYGRWVRGSSMLGLTWYAW
jgi:hypothetical protein